MGFNTCRLQPGFVSSPLFTAELWAWAQDLLHHVLITVTVSFLLCTSSYGLCFSAFQLLFLIPCVPQFLIFLFPTLLSLLSSLTFCIFSTVSYAMLHSLPFPVTLARGGTGSEWYSKFLPTIYFTVLLVLLNTLFAIMAAANTVKPPLSRGRYYG